MKGNYILLMSLCALSVLSFNSCKDDDTTEGTSPAVTEAVPLQLTGLTIRESTAESLDAATSRVSANKWDVNDQIGVFMLQDGTYNIAAEASNKAYFTESGDGKFLPLPMEGIDNTLYLPADGSYMDIVAYYPYKELTDNILSVDITDQSNQAALDLMRGTPDKLAYNNANPQADLTFRRKMSQIVITMQAGDGVDETELQGTQIQLEGFHSTGSFDPIRDKLVIGENLSSVNLLVAEDGKSAMGIVLPEDEAAQRKLVIRAGYNLNGVPFTYDISEEQTFLPGRSYNFSVTFFRERIEVSTSITDWVDGGKTEGAIIDDSDSL